MSHFVDCNLELAGICQRKLFCGPHHVVIDLTNRCNAGCLVCWTYSPMLQKENRAPKEWYSQEIPYDAFEKMIHDLAELGCERIRFTGGGEPMQYPRFHDAVRLVKEKGIWLAITTNGLELNPETSHFLREAQVDEIAISLWAASADSWVKQHPRRKAEEYYEILKNIALLRQGNTGPDVSLLNVINTHNCDEIENMADLARNLGCTAMYLTLVDAMDDTMGVVLNEEQKSKALESVARLKQKFYYPEQIQFDNLHGFEDRLKTVEKEVFYDRNRIDKIPCYIGWHFCRVMANGDIAPCCRGVDYPMGNICESSFKEIWSSKKYKNFRRLALDEKKDNPYFKKMDCYRMCDNLMHNEQIQSRLDELSKEQLSELESYSGKYLQEVPKKNG
jgi:MoaA/NifB/PqqE/SkfB family radical SAM enzyme